MIFIGEVYGNINNKFLKINYNRNKFLMVLFIRIFKINFDWVKDKVDKAVIDFYIRNYRGKLIRAGIFKCSYTLFIVAKILGLIEGILEVKMMGL